MSDWVQAMANVKVGANNYLAVTDLGDDSVWTATAPGTATMNTAALSTVGGSQQPHKYPTIFMHWHIYHCFARSISIQKLMLKAVVDCFCKSI